MSNFNENIILAEKYSKQKKYKKAIGYCGNFLIKE
jgi:hypothetical protein